MSLSGVTMSYKIIIEKRADKSLKSITKRQRKWGERINFFINNSLQNAENPCTLPNCKKLQGFNDNRYRWRLGDYRIIGIVENEEFKIIQIIKISKRDDSTYKGL